VRRRESGFSLSSDKNPIYVESGRRGARKRWGGQRILRLDELTPDQRRLVLALVEAAKADEPQAVPDAA
jgi:hypothetical protein